MNDKYIKNILYFFLANLNLTKLQIKVNLIGKVPLDSVYTPVTTD